ncbi:7-cyano-7-deazaguanine synthase [Sorangium sp. So ce295]|uniref:7-cyano-7-deazaguanine synthase n=1 Tax=Sorangium sp. So ce295 TaxID=3133295 RepID=UPI003F648A89
MIEVKYMRIEPEVLVLLSGGVDSAATVAFYLDFGRPPAALFIDYAQPARYEEAQAAAALAAHFGISLSVATWSGPTAKRVGLIRGRNLFLLAAALMERPSSVSVLALGLHAGTAYADSSAPFVRAAEDAVGESGERGVTVAAPFLEWPKGDVYAYARRERIPLSLTYSCEAAGGPCGQCLSCADRKMLDARA